MSRHFQEEWSFRVVYTKNGKVVEKRRCSQTEGYLFLTEKDARKGMEIVSSWESSYLKEHEGDGAYDAYEIYAPVRRIVTEWEDSEEDGK